MCMPNNARRSIRLPDSTLRARPGNAVRMSTLRSRPRSIRKSRCVGNAVACRRRFLRDNARRWPAGRGLCRQRASPAHAVSDRRARCACRGLLRQSGGGRCRAGTHSCGRATDSAFAESRPPINEALGLALLIERGMPPEQRSSAASLDRPRLRACCRRQGAAPEGAVAVEVTPIISISTARPSSGSIRTPRCSRRCVRRPFSAAQQAAAAGVVDIIGSDHRRTLSPRRHRTHGGARAGHRA